MEIILQSLSTLLVLVGGTLGTYGFTQIAKRMESLPSIVEGNAPALRATAGVVALVAVLLTSLADGKVDPTNLQNLVTGIIELGIMWGGSHVVHEQLKEKGEKSE